MTYPSIHKEKDKTWKAWLKYVDCQDSNLSRWHFFLSCKLNWGLHAVSVCPAAALLPGVRCAIAGKRVFLLVMYKPTAGHQPFSVQSVDMAAQQSFCVDIMADQLWVNNSSYIAEQPHRWHFTQSVILTSPESSTPVVTSSAVSYSDNCRPCSFE